MAVSLRDLATIVFFGLPGALSLPWLVVFVWIPDNLPFLPCIRRPLSQFQRIVAK